MPPWIDWLDQRAPRLAQWLRRVLPRLPDERQVEVLQELGAAASPGFDFFLLVVLSCSIATFGLITDSTAVIIGAMLVAPLMSPILGLSLASVSGEQVMFRRSSVALLQGALLAVLLSAIVSRMAQSLPLGVLLELPSEVLARIHPSPFDLGIALAGGAAAAYALAQPRLSAALPGVAIATALMPPLCTVGVGLALQDASVALGALLLFLTNFAAISFAGILVFAAMGFRPLSSPYAFREVPRSLLISAALVLFITVPLVLLSLRFVSETRALQNVHDAVETEVMRLDGAELIDIRTDFHDNVLDLRVTMRAYAQPAYELVVDMQKSLAVRLQQTVELQLIVVPYTRLDPLVPPTPTLTPTLTPTWTPGPSPTLTLTPTVTPSPTLTPTETPTPTYTYTPTDTSTPTNTYTPTPVLAYISGTGGKGVALRDAPDGAIIGYLPENSPVRLLYQRQTVKDREWIEVRDVLDRTGWVLALFLIIRP